MASSPDTPTWWATLPQQAMVQPHSNQGQGDILLPQSQPTAQPLQDLDWGEGGRDGRGAGREHRSLLILQHLPISNLASRRF